MAWFRSALGNIKTRALIIEAKVKLLVFLICHFFPGMKRKADANVKTPNAKRRLDFSSPKALPPNIKMQVDREVRKELSRKTDWRVTDLSAALQATSTNGSLYDLQANLARGDLDFNNFEGNTIFPKWLQIKWQIQTATGNVKCDSFRIVVGQQVGGASVPTAANLLQVNGTNGLSAISAFNNEYKQAFRILVDQLIDVGNYDSTAISNCKSGDIFIPGWKLRQIDFNAGSAVPIRGGLFYFISCNTTPVVAAPNHSFYARIKFST